MKYIILCGGVYPTITPRHLWEIHGEPIVKRTIRLLRECGIEDISISSRDERFEGLGVPVIKHKNDFDYHNDKSYWLDAFPIFETPVCYIFGDVVFSRNAIEQIVNHETDSIQFYASGKPFAENYIKPWGEPFAYKVIDTEKFVRCINQAKQWQDEGKFNRMPVSWELWQVIQGTPINKIIQDYYVISDYTCDVDNEQDLRNIEIVVPKED